MLEIVFKTSIFKTEKPKSLEMFYCSILLFCCPSLRVCIIWGGLGEAGT